MKKKLWLSILKLFLLILGILVVSYLVFTFKGAMS